MAKGKNQWTTPHPSGGWQVKGAGNSKATVRTETKDQAVKVGKEIAKHQGAEHFITGKDGKIQDRNSYGNDPNPPKDKN